jgi:hypothetical protein
VSRKNRVVKPLPATFRGRERRRSRFRRAGLRRLIAGPQNRRCRILWSIEVSGRLVAVGLVLVAAVASTAAAGSQQSVTMQVERFYEQEFGVWRLRFTGTIPSGAAGEYVAITRRGCGYRGFTAIGGATTAEGGQYEAIPRFGLPPQSGVFRALWRGRVSESVTLRSPVQMNVIKQRRARRYVVTIVAESNLSRRFVALQRLTGGRWTHLRRARLVSVSGGGFGGIFRATFVVRKAGLRLRVFVPEATVGACHDPTASPTFGS